MSKNNINNSISQEKKRKIYFKIQITNTKFHLRK